MLNALHSVCHGPVRACDVSAHPDRDGGDEWGVEKGRVRRLYTFRQMRCGTGARCTVRIDTENLFSISERSQMDDSQQNVTYSKVHSCGKPVHMTHCGARAARLTSALSLTPSKTSVANRAQACCLWNNRSSLAYS